MVCELGSHEGSAWMATICLRAHRPDAVGSGEGEREKEREREREREAEMRHTEWEKAKDKPKVKIRNRGEVKMCPLCLWPKGALLFCLSFFYLCRCPSLPQRCGSVCSNSYLIIRPAPVSHYTCHFTVSLSLSFAFSWFAESQLTLSGVTFFFTSWVLFYSAHWSGNGEREREREREKRKEWEK